MQQDGNEIIGEHFQWIAATSEIQDLRTGSSRPDSAYNAKVDVYEDRVLFWFLDIAKSHVVDGTAPGDYVALSIAIAYIEGVEQYRRGERTPRRKSGEWFKSGVRRIFPQASANAVNRLWSAVRNGLFHDGFTKGPTLLSHAHPGAIGIRGRHLIINPAIFVGGILRDFDTYVGTLRADASGVAAANFTAVWDDQWNET